MHFVEKLPLTLSSAAVSSAIANNEVGTVATKGRAVGLSWLTVPSHSLPISGMCVYCNDTFTCPQNG